MSNFRLSERRMVELLAKYYPEHYGHITDGKFPICMPPHTKNLKFHYSYAFEIHRMYRLNQIVFGYIVFLHDYTKMFDLPDPIDQTPLKDDDSYYTYPRPNSCDRFMVEPRIDLARDLMAIENYRQRFDKEYSPAYELFVSQHSKTKQSAVNKKKLSSVNKKVIRKAPKRPLLPGEPGFVMSEGLRKTIMYVEEQRKQEKCC